MPLKNSFGQLKEAYHDLSEPEYMGKFAGFFWHVLIVLAALAILCALTYAGLRFMEVQSTLTNASATQGKSSASKDIDKNLLQNVIDGFDARSQHFLSAASATSSLSDPSR